MLIAIICNYLHNALDCCAVDDFNTYFLGANPMQHKVLTWYKHSICCAFPVCSHIINAMSNSERS